MYTYSIKLDLKKLPIKYNKTWVFRIMNLEYALLFHFSMSSVLVTNHARSDS